VTSRSIWHPVFEGAKHGQDLSVDDDPQAGDAWRGILPDDLNAADSDKVPALSIRVRSFVRQSISKLSSRRYAPAVLAAPSTRAMPRTHWLCLPPRRFVGPPIRYGHDSYCLRGNQTCPELPLCLALISNMEVTEFFLSRGALYNRWYSKSIKNGVDTDPEIAESIILNPCTTKPIGAFPRCQTLPGPPF
jgi:hypothetical protein